MLVSVIVLNVNLPPNSQVELQEVIDISRVPCKGEYIILDHQNLKNKNPVSFVVETVLHYPKTSENEFRDYSPSNVEALIRCNRISDI